MAQRLLALMDVIMRKKQGHSTRRALYTALAVLVAFCFCIAASPVHAEEVSEPSSPIRINGDTANVAVNLFADENHTQPIDGA